jgi:SAM-dependent methyltransferase
MLALQARSDAPRYLIDDYAEDVLDRLSFLRIEPAKALVIGDYAGSLSAALGAIGCAVLQAEPAFGFEEERPFAQTGFDLIVGLGTLDTVNDLPGALVHIRNALAPGGMMIASLPGAGSLPALRAAMLAADGDRPAPRLHPMIDVRAGGQLLQRAGLADPVIDSRPLDVGFRSLASLLADLRAQGLSNVLADPGPPLGAVALQRACTAFAGQMQDARTVEHFELLTLSGWRR